MIIHDGVAAREAMEQLSGFEYIIFDSYTRFSQIDHRHEPPPPPPTPTPQKPIPRRRM